MKILILAGGASGEREVSLNSARAICDGLKRLGHAVTALDPASGANLLGADSGWSAQLSHSTTPSDSTAISANAKPFALAVSIDRLKDADLVFLALHGGAGEDGTLQALLDLAGTPYTGSGRVASTIAMLKPLTKRVAMSLGVPTAPWRDISRADMESAVNEGSFIHELGAPLIVKPADGGSSVGLVVVNEVSALRPALEECLRYTSHAMVERYIKGRELTVTVFDSAAWPIVEIRPKGGIYDYDAKYTKGGSEYLCPAPIESSIAKRVSAHAVEIYRAIGCAGLARLDFILDSAEVGYFLEVNTLPGMTELSLAPQSARAHGMSFDDLLHRMIDSALTTHRKST